MAARGEESAEPEEILREALDDVSSLALDSARLKINNDDVESECSRGGGGGGEGSGIHNQHGDATQSTSTSSSAAAAAAAVTAVKAPATASGAESARSSASATAAKLSVDAAATTELACEHVDPGAEACLYCQQSRVELTRRAYAMCKDELGIGHDNTIEAAFSLFDRLIQAYALTDCDALLVEIEPSCRMKEKQRTYSRFIQALAFLRFKQNKFQQAAELFEEMKTLLGPSAELMENMGHAYNSCGDCTKAEDSFTLALQLIELRPPDQQARSNLGGVLLGLGLVRLNRHDAEGALPQLQRAFEWYKKAHPGDHSLQAKAASSVARCYESMRNLDMAEKFLREAVRIFRITCGEDCPLTSNALAKLGSVLLQKKSADAADVLHDAFSSSAAVDMFSVNLETVAMLLIQLVDHSGAQRLQERAAQYASLCSDILTKLKKRGDTMEDANAAIFYKCYGEVSAVGGDLKAGKVHLQEAVRILSNLEKGGDTAQAASMVKQQCLSMLDAVDRAAKAKQAPRAASNAGTSSVHAHGR